MTAQSATSNQLLSQGWTQGRTEELVANPVEQTSDLRQYYQEDNADVRKGKMLSARSTGRNRAALKRAILTAIVKLTVPRVTANLLSRDKYPRYHHQSTRLHSQDTLTGHLKMLVFLDKTVKREAMVAFGVKEPEKFWSKIREWFRRSLLEKWDPSGRVLKHCEVRVIV